MITVVLEDKNSKEVKRLSCVDNESIFLKQELPTLGNIDGVSVDVFGVDDMKNIVTELAIVRPTVNDLKLRAHLDEVIQLALMGINLSGSTLTFTPFGDLYK